MPSNRHKSVTLMVIAVALGIGVIALWMNRPTANQNQRDADAIIQLLRDDLSSVKSAPIESASEQQLLEFFAQVPSGPPPGLPDQLPPGLQLFQPTSEQETALLGLLATWLKLLHEGNGEAYAEWMRSRGYALTEEPSLIERTRKSIEFFTGSPPPPQEGHGELFVSVFEGALRQASGDIRPNALSMAEYGSRIRFMSIGNVRTLTDAFVFGEADAERWIGYAVAGSFLHWEPPVLMEEIIDRQGHVDAAMVSFAYQSDSGKWRPLNVFLFLDPATDSWHFRTAAIVNSPNIQANLHF